MFFEIRLVREHFLQVAALLDSIRKNMDTEFGREQKDRQRIVEANEGLLQQAS